MKLTIMGPPGGGKGTQAEILRERLGLLHISTGAIIRKAISEKTPLGLAAESYIAEGKLVPDDVIISMVKERISEPDCEKGYILDGFPRTIPQAEAMEGMGIDLDCALDIEVEDEAIVDRLSGRRECKECAAPYHVKYNPPKVEGKCDKCGGELITRSDDVPDTIRQRLNVYHAQTEPLKKFYESKNLLRTAKGCEELEDTTKNVLEALGVE
ncbi:MAG: adenylate kinase [Clostridia bacterium]